ncbi:MAG: hypothetical protein Q9207_003925 [Kuettlingeria erythrocarpa]
MVQAQAHLTARPLRLPPCVQVGHFTIDQPHRPVVVYLEKNATCDDLHQQLARRRQRQHCELPRGLPKDPVQRNFHSAKWSSTRIDEHAQTALADGADDTHQDQRRLRGREEFLRGLVEDPSSSHHIYIFTDFVTSNPRDAMLAEAYRLAALTRDDRAFIPMILRSDSAEQDYGHSLPTGPAGTTAEPRQSAQLYRFETPEEIEINVSQRGTEEVAEELKAHVQRCMGENDENEV